MSIPNGVWSLTVVALIVASPCAGGPVAPAPLNALVDNADAVVVATLQSATPRPKGFELTLSVVRAPKSTTAPPPSVQALWETAGPAPVTGGPHGLWFLKVVTKEPLEWVILPAKTGSISLKDAFIPLSPSLDPAALVADGEPATDTGASVLDAVVQELRVLIKKAQDPAVVAPVVEAAITLLAAPLASDLSHPAAGEHRYCPTRKLLQEFDGLLAARIDGELAAGRAATLPLGLAQALCMVSDPVAVPAVIRIAVPSWRGAASTSPVVRRCAAQALTNVHNAQTLPTLATLLVDPDLEIRYIAVSGFGLHANGYAPTRGLFFPVEGSSPLATSQTRRNSPAHAVFMQDPDRYVGFWQNWWSCEPCRLDRGVPTVAIAHSGTCTGPSCTVLFSATAADPDDDPMSLSWSGCATGEGPTLTCDATVPGVVAAQVVVRDAYGESSFSSRPAPIYAAAYSTTPWSGCAGTGAYSCTSSASDGCARPGTRSRAVAVAALTLDAASAVAAPPAVESCIQTQAGYVETYATSPWSACSAPCGGGHRTRSVSPDSWDATAPHASAPADNETCNMQACALTCHDYEEMYTTQSECQGAWPVCEIRYRPDGVGGTLTCWKGFP